jgi:hypothetical protein
MTDLFFTEIKKKLNRVLKFINKYINKKILF